MLNQKTKINFFPINLNIPDNLFPKPASLCLPDWYKKQESYNFKDKKVINGVVAMPTIKKCMPVFDSITFGYIVFSTTDIYVSQKNGFPYFNWPTNSLNIDMVSFHQNDQFSEYPKFKDLPSLPKFFNPWIIETPKGYSCFIISPVHRELPFEILPAVVDTDSYGGTVDFPFYLKDPNWEGLIPSGTPIAQVIPFKREDWKMSVIFKKNITEKILKFEFLINLHFFNRYKKLFWKKKNFN